MKSSTDSAHGRRQLGVLATLMLLLVGAIVASSRAEAATYIKIDQHYYGWGASMDITPSPNLPMVGFIDNTTARNCGRPDGSLPSSSSFRVYVGAFFEPLEFKSFTRATNGTDYILTLVSVEGDVVCSTGEVPPPVGSTTLFKDGFE